MHKLPLIHIGDQVFAKEAGTEFGAVRSVAPGGRPAITIYVENSGDFEISLDAVKSVHDGKVVLDVTKLETPLREAITRAHSKEEPGL